MSKRQMRGINTHAGKDDKEKEAEDPSFFDRIKKVRSRLKLGPHHKMERFSVTLSITLVFLLVLTGISFTSHRSDVSALQSSQAMFTESFSYSLSGQRGRVLGVYGDENKSDVMLLFEMNDIASMSTNAENYELFITGERDSVDPEIMPDVSYSMFGSTGYGMIRFQQPGGEPIEPQVLNITLRSHADLAESQNNESSAGEDDELIDETFANNDQAQIFVNPGAENVETLDNLEVGETDPERIYTALVAEPQEAEIMADIEKTVGEMNTQLNRMDEYSSRLESSGFVVPETPWFVEGDYIDENGVFQPATLLSKGHDVDYGYTSIWDGYVNQVVDSRADFNDYMAEINADPEPEERQEIQQHETVERIEVLENTTGGDVVLSEVMTGSSASDQVTAKDTVEALSGTWRSYLSSKGTLQRKHMNDLLLLDADVLGQSNFYSEHSGEDAVFFY